MKKLKLLIMASVFYPQKMGGGPSKSIMNVIKSIKNEYDIFVISHNHEVNNRLPLRIVKNGWNQSKYGSTYYFNYKEDNFRNVLKELKFINPAIIYINSLMSYNYTLPCLIYKKFFNRKVRILIAPRGELSRNALAIKAIRKRAYLKILKISTLLNGIIWHSTSQEEQNDLMSILKINRNLIYLVDNLSLCRGSLNNRIRKEKGRLKIVSISRIHPIKNILNSLKYLSFCKGDIVYDIYGPIEDRRFWEKCEEVIEKMPENIGIKYCGFIENNGISKILENYHAFYLPTLSENYGHSIVEALCNYMPVIISDQTPWSDINTHHCGYAIPIENENGYISALSEMVDLDNKEYINLCINAGNYITKKIDNDKIIKKYVLMFQNIMK